MARDEMDILSDFARRYNAFRSSGSIKRDTFVKFANDMHGYALELCNNHALSYVDVTSYGAFFHTVNKQTGYLHEDYSKDLAECVEDFIHQTDIDLWELIGRLRELGLLDD